MPHAPKASWSDSLVHTETIVNDEPRQDDRIAVMPRPEKPLDPFAGPVEQFAFDLRKLREKAEFSWGWNAQTNEFGDLYAQGVIDPAKVVRTALQDAASVAGLLVTTEAMIAEKPKKDKAPALPAGAEMDF